MQLLSLPRKETGILRRKVWRMGRIQSCVMYIKARRQKNMYAAQKGIVLRELPANEDFFSADDT